MYSDNLNFKSGTSFYKNPPTVTASPVEAAISIDKQSFKINFKNCLSTVGCYIEDLFLTDKNSIEKWLYKQMKSVAKLKQRIRPNRSYPRVSFKPRRSWTAFGRANGA